MICHIYPRRLPDRKASISYEPEDIAWAVRCAVEMGADVVKTPYCGDIDAFAQIARDCPVPLVAAGGPQSGTLAAHCGYDGRSSRGGARGATIGRNVWGFPNITGNVEAFKLRHPRSPVTGSGDDEGGTGPLVDPEPALTAFR